MESTQGKAPGFTPGPWRIVRDPNSRNLLVCASPSHVATVAFGASSDNAEDNANADLLAAAPDLYAALREAYEALHDIINAAGNDDPYTREELEGQFSDIAGNAWAALAKAEGGAR